jgi:hypothetical protein
LRELVAGERALTHAALDELADSKTIRHLRSVLVATGALASRDEHMIRLERWITATVAGRRDHRERQMLHRYATWHALRRLRRRAGGQHITLGQAVTVQRHVRAAITLLDWLTSRGLDLVRAENLIHGSDQHSYSSGALPVMVTGHVPAVRLRHEALVSRTEVEDLCLLAVAAAGWSWRGSVALADRCGWWSTGLDLGQAPGDQAGNVDARRLAAIADVQDLADVLQGEPGGLRVPNERQALQDYRIVVAVARGACGPAQGGGAGPPRTGSSWPAPWPAGRPRRSSSPPLDIPVGWKV